MYKTPIPKKKNSFYATYRLILFFSFLNIVTVMEDMYCH